MPYIPPIRTWDLLEKDRNKNTSYNFDDDDIKITKEESKSNTTVRGTRNKIYFCLNSLCVIYWIFQIYNSIVTQNISDLRNNAILGSFISILLFSEHALNNLLDNNK